MVLMRQVALRLTKGKPAEPGRFPGQVLLPRMCFRPNMEGQGERLGRIWRPLCWLLAACTKCLERGNSDGALYLNLHNSARCTAVGLLDS